MWSAMNASRYNTSSNMSQPSATATGFEAKPLSPLAMSKSTSARAAFRFKSCALEDCGDGIDGGGGDGAWGGVGGGCWCCCGADVGWRVVGGGGGGGG